MKQIFIPRALEWCMIIPPPHPNVYLFRNTLGRIVKSFNLYGLKIENSHLIAPGDLSEPQLVYHSAKDIFRSAEIRRHYALFYENGPTKPFDVYIFTEGGVYYIKSVIHRMDDVALPGIKYGLIDTTGKIIVPPRYDFISDFNSEITVVMLNKKKGLINDKGIELIKCTFDNIIIQEDVAIATSGKNITLFNIKGKKINHRNYQGEIDFFKGTSIVYVKGKGYGVINTNGKELCHLMQFDAIEKLPQLHKDGKRYYEARKGNKEYYISQAGEIIEK